MTLGSTRIHRPGVKNCESVVPRFVPKMLHFCAITQNLLVGSDEDEPITFLQREVNGVIYRCPVIIDSDDEPIMPTYLRSICANLRIPPSSFGLHLG
jgi:hypothetical protein